MVGSINNLPRGFRQESDLGRVRYNSTYIGIIKRNDDYQMMGRLAVWIPEIGGDPLDEQSWFYVSYAPPFAGVTSPFSLVQNSTDMSGSQQSYGFWMQPPDLENQVLICFVNGDTSRGYWFACVVQQNMNHMIPGLASGTPAKQVETCTNDPPVVEYNKYSDENPDNPKRPVFTPLHNGLSTQGLYKDTERGVSTTSARREAPSKVFGYLTPRGNSIHVDDNPANEFIRMRTRSGAQVLVHETTGYVYINSKDGNSWVEISDKGVDVYSAGDVSLRSEGSLNLHADGSLNIEADGNLNFRAGGNMTFQSAHHTSFAGNGNFALELGGVFSAQAVGNLVLAAGGALQMGAQGSISQASGGANIRTAASIQDNSDQKAPAPETITPVVEQPRDLPEVNGEKPCYQQDTRKTIVRRLPTHEPFAGHPTSSDSSTSRGGTTSSSEYASAADSASTAGGVVPPGGEASDLQNLPTSDLDWLAACMLDEAGNQGTDGMAAVAQVIKNRMATSFHSDGTIKGTVLSKDQFSGFYFDTSPSWHRVASTEAEAEQRGITKINTYKRSAGRWNAALQLGQQVMAGSYAGSTEYQTLKAHKRATQYLNLPVTERNNPNGSWKEWATQQNFATKIGDHSFYYA